MKPLPKFPILAVLALVAASAGAAPPAGVPVPTIELTPGGAQMLSFDTDVGAALIGEPETADVNALDTRQLFVLGRAPGITSLRVHDTAGGLIAAYAVRVSVQPSFAETVVERVAGAGANIDVEAVGEALFVSGTAESPAQAEQVLRGIRAVSAAPVVDSLELSGSAQVNLDVLISEVSSNITREFGIDWSVRSNPFTSLDPFSNPLHSPINGTRLATGALELVRQTVNIVDLESGAEVLSYEDLDVGATPRLAEGGIVLSHSKVVNSGEYQATAFLEAMAENGLLVVHARPTLTAVSGQPAEFFSGLEIPLPVVAERGTVGTQYSEVGVGLSFTPTVLDSGQISLLVEPRIREVVNGGANIAGAFVPNINERSASTRVELGDGESIAIAGLYRRISNSGESGIPMLKDIPLWGALFRSSRQREESVELIIVVTPRIVSGVPPALLAARSQPAQSARQLANEFHY